MAHPYDDRDSETFEEQMDRLRAMAADERGDTWDLSDNDRAAIAWLLQDRERLRSAVLAAEAYLEAEGGPGDDDARASLVAALRAALESR